MKFLDGRLLKVFNRCRSKKEPPYATRVATPNYNPPGKGVQQKINLFKSNTSKDATEMSTEEISKCGLCPEAWSIKLPLDPWGPKNNQAVWYHIKCHPTKRDGYACFFYCGPNKRTSIHAWTPVINTVIWPVQGWDQGTISCRKDYCK